MVKHHLFEYFALRQHTNRQTMRQIETDLEAFVASSPLCSTHEHTDFETSFASRSADVLSNVFDNYVLSDLVTAGASRKAVESLVDHSNPDLKSRFSSVKDAWSVTRNTGYGRAAALIAHQLYGIDEITIEAIEAAQASVSQESQSGERLRILQDIANLDHVQIDHMDRHVPAEAFGQDFFLYDINVCRFCDGTPEVESLFEETGIEIGDLDDLVEALSKIFDHNADIAVAAKSQHAYHRTLRWQKRERSDAEAAFQSWTKLGLAASSGIRQCLGDWLWARAVELTVRHNLPFKIHTGYYDGCGSMNVDFIRPANLCELLQAYPNARFVLMHIGYPYDNELIAMAKHYPNVVVDMCWAWSINPRVSCEFVRRFLNAVPANKLFAFGGDSVNPSGSVGYALQSRDWLARALQNEVDEELLTERNAIEIAERLMMQNQYDYFDVLKKKAASKAATQARMLLQPGLVARVQFPPSLGDFAQNIHAPWQHPSQS